MAQIRLHLIATIAWFALLFNIERLDIPDQSTINIDTSVYVIIICLSVLVLSYPDLGRLNLGLSLGIVLAAYFLVQTLFDPVWIDASPFLLVINLLALVITLLMMRRLGQALVDFEVAVEAFILDVHGSRMLSRTQGEDEVNHELYRARRFERPVAIVCARVVDNNQIERTEINTDFVRWQITDTFHRRFLQVKLAQTIASLTYKSDIIVEYNGGVVVCLPETNEQEAEAFAHQLDTFAREIAGFEVQTGIACFPDDGLILDDLVQHAQQNSRSWNDTPPDDGMNGPGGHVLVNTDQRLHIEKEAAWVNKLTYQSYSSRYIYRVSKRVIELLVLLVGSVVALPLMAALALAIFLDDPGPVVFTQWRTGYGGRRFKIYKFRTMVVDAATMPAQVIEDANGRIRYAWPEKLEDDPRITRVGRFLRKTSLDELPQIYNVIRGDMSVVGPRPTSWDLNKYTLYQTSRLTVRPGITGLWQVCARDTTNFDERLLWDLKYIEKMSLWLDIQILWRTFAQIRDQSGV